MLRAPIEIAGLFMTLKVVFSRHIYQRVRSEGLETEN